jgi:hypothetical protein
LFGIFTYRFEKFDAVKLSAVGAQVAHMLIRVFLYADDLVLFAESICDLKALLYVVHLSCFIGAMTVNIKKSEVVFFSVVHAKQNSKCCVNNDKVTLSVVPSLRHIGLCFDSSCQEVRRQISG